MEKKKGADDKLILSDAGPLKINNLCANVKGSILRKWTNGIVKSHVMT